MAITARHYVQQPTWLTFVRIAQLLLAFLILALVSFALSAVPGGNAFGTFGFNIFCSLYTFITLGYILVTPRKAAHLYNCWAALVLEIFMVIFWLCAFATLASWSSAWVLWDALTKRSYDDNSYSSSFDDDSYSSALDAAADALAKFRAGWRCAAAAGGLGGILWILALVSLVTYSVFLHRHRRSPENKGLPEDGSPGQDSEGAKGVEMHMGGVAPYPQA